MEKYKDARRIFGGLISGTPTLEAHFNLGLAYSGLKDYDSAAKQFRKAIEIDPNDAESHYELGYALFKKGDRDGAYGQYYILEKLDEGLAESLRMNAKLFDVKPRKEGKISVKEIQLPEQIQN